MFLKASFVVQCRRLEWNGLTLCPQKDLSHRHEAGRTAGLLRKFHRLNAPNGRFLHQVVIVIPQIRRKNSTERQNSRGSLSVLSPFDEQEEWLKILEILNACNSGLEDRNGEQDACNHLLSDVQRELQNRFGESTSLLPSVPFEAGATKKSRDLCRRELIY